MIRHDDGPWYPAPAKLNLMLHVVGRRPDGYHELQTVFRFLDRADLLAFRVREDGRVTRAPDIPGLAPEADLCVRAARLLQHETGTRLGVDITLDKRLPMGGGLGGGSSDAATTLLVLDQLWQLGLGRARLQALGLALGADVPVFVFGESAFAEGVGEQLTPVGLPPAWYLVLVPPVHVQTAAVFRHPQLTRNANRIKIPAFFPGGGRNDLEAVVRREYPEVERHLQWLGRYSAARMSGSGACVFASFDDEESALEVLSELPADMQGFVAKGIDRHPLRDLNLGSRQAG